jgi:hypothetical protein
MSRRARSFGTAAVMAAAMLVWAGAASAGTLDQQQTDISNGAAAVGNGESISQTFTPGLSGALDRVDLSLSTFSATAPLTVQIRNASGAGPGTSVLASISVPIAAAPVNPANAFVPVVFAAAPSVTAGTQYAIVAISTDGTNSWGWLRTSSTSAYAGGSAFSVAAGPPANSGWGALTGDQAFKTYVTVAAPPAAGLTGQRAAALKKCKKKHSHKKRKKCRKTANLLPV